MRVNSSKKTVLVMMLGILALFGVALIYFTMEYVASVKQAGMPPMPATTHQIELLLLVVTMMAGFPAVGLGAYVMYVGSRIRATGQWPPAGISVQSKSPIALGRRANLFGFAAMGLGGLLAFCGLTLPLLGWRLVNMFLPGF